jgi:hypothetical protein
MSSGNSACEAIMKRAISAFACVLTCGIAVAANVKDDIAAAQNEVARLSASVKIAAAPLLLKDTDIQVFISTAPIVEAANRLAALPPQSRAVAMLSRARNGYFWSDGATWCNSYVELFDGNALQVRGSLDALSATVADDGAIHLNPTLSVSGHIQFHFHFMGPRIRGPFGIGGGVCPPGGGVGTSIGVDFSKGQPIVMRVGFDNSSNDALHYSVAIISPASIDVTAQVGLGQIGNIGVPQSFDLPRGPIARGEIPLLVKNSGEFQLPDRRVRKYALVLQPKQFQPSKAGLLASWTAVVEFR